MIEIEVDDFLARCEAREERILNEGLRFKKSLDELDSTSREDDGRSGRPYRPIDHQKVVVKVLDKWKNGTPFTGKEMLAHIGLPIESMSISTFGSTYKKRLKANLKTRGYDLRSSRVGNETYYTITMIE